MPPPAPLPPPKTPPPAAIRVAVVEDDAACRQSVVQALRRVARGHTLDEVAQTLGVTRHTVRSFVRRIYGKLQVHTRAQAVHAAMRQGWLDE